MIIIISGHAGVGKDTAAKMIQSKLQLDGYRVLITHYADLLKYICRTFFDWNGQKDEYGRSLLQCIGTDIIRKYRSNYFVDFLADMLEFFQGEWDYVIIPDARFPNEIERWKEYGANTVHIRIVRPSYTSTLTEQQKEHQSETALDKTKPGYLIENDGSLDRLNIKLTQWVMEALYAKK